LRDAKASGRKAFFFRKNKQKTFGCLASASPDRLSLASANFYEPLFTTLPGSLCSWKNPVSLKFAYAQTAVSIIPILI
jgi:hypothetical protein